MVSDYFYYILWLLAHTVVALITQTRDVYLLVYNRTRNILSPRGNRQVLADLLKLKKLPQHVTVLLPSSPETSRNHQNNTLDVLVNLVLWSLATNISYISFYDPQGVLVKKEEELMKKIQSKISSSQHLIFHGVNTTGKNGFAGPKIHVKILTSGRSSIVDACKALAHKDEKLTVPIISKHLLTSYEFPDPQLAIYFGEYLNLCGYPPWQVRLTEFVHAGRLHAFDQRHFIDVLARYNQCQQRVGK